MPLPHRLLGAALAAVLLLSGCSWFENEEERLEGERIPVRRAEGAGPVAQVVELPLIAARTLDAWTQTNANAAHNAGHIAGPTTLNEVWRADAGTGASSDATITSAPVVAGGSVFTLDAAAQVSAFDARSGSQRWRVDLTPEDEGGEEGFGGGLAVAGNALFVTTGFGEVVALSTGTGETLWRQRFGGPFRAGPAVAGGRVVAVTRNSQALALDAATGAVLWRRQGVEADAGLLGGASPAIAGGGALVPFASGELAALDLESGRRIWNTVITGGRRGFARASITDLTGDPVVAGPLVIVANQSGRLAATVGANGERAWTRALGATSPLWPAGATLFMVSDTGRLLRLDARDGRTLWEVALPVFEDPEDREDPIVYSGPIVVSGRILLTDNLGNLLSYDAITGEGGETGVRLSSGSVTGPVIAGDTVYVLADDGVLHAFR